ncbi:phosphoenolpyruvate--protein phosphotransferase [Solemya velum gill symbiont]|uniref:phosphoenolpyruvate--protein phosphotransferase n=1 Tax=Solemya velum gill symbiont TaxID=2340 RepID=UPI0009967543|nr:phosphoenolpyruvate--protein phosphotransferase [Solemya velum gill symbiont]OOY99309.1 phosphoenolpyruvate--protein phosphotransferase [Solemya velum gill symbiont]OOZ01483.1 phosphoenolpyruvate--protein phosphotransferase [Solemya velum gill symbiont]OOZ03764.1 phosphoenolpyruvate--protein phosphotransferase [Solemya velum gill symbiont]OOZ05993.1 phosphoenolpyruvate--protein phosphotransferase [Solemya velum gill symbiont]OOZ08213.1 phosphoenolpyruvate--protein phosphotransferase [Solemy
MLTTLHRIVQEVNGASDLSEALEIIVKSVREAVATDVCSVYLTDFEQRKHLLMATDGLRPEAVGKVALPMFRGLVGLVCERAEPINLDDAPSHSRYLPVSGTGEKYYHGFLGVPIIQNRKVLGVLVVRHIEPRRFEDDEVTFLLTLAAQLAGAITHAQASGELTRIRSGTDAVSEGFLQGRPSSSGVVIGSAVVAYQLSDLDAVPDRRSDDPAAEVLRFRKAIAAVQDDLHALREKMEHVLQEEDRALFDAWLMMLSEDALVERAVSLINEESQWAPGALRQSVLEHISVFDSMEDSYLRERASDIRDLGRRVLMHLQEEQTNGVDYPERTILVGEEVSAVQLMEVPEDRLAGVVSSTGSGSSHVAILARAIGVPAVMGLTDLPVSRVEGQDVIVDGYRGRFYVAPADSVCQEYERLITEEQQLGRELDELRGHTSETTDSFHLPLYLNTGLASEMSDLGITEAEGIGLYRTEFPFMTRDTFPGEETQIIAYRHVLETFNPRPAIMRTLDIGGDKPLPYFPFTESNPFLGWRGVRISLDHPEIFLTQVRAMLRASIGYENLRILLPMITTIGEIDELQQLISRAYDELQEEGYEIIMPEIGVMIEVPAAVYQAEEIAKRVDFISIGSNDLTQYLLAVDRNNPRVAELYDDLHPAVLQAVHHVVKAGTDYGCPVGICGELAGNPLATPLLLGMGVDSLSMSAGSLLRVKWVIRSLSRARCKQLLKKALQHHEAQQVHQMMNKVLGELGLEGLVRPGR